MLRLPDPCLVGASERDQRASRDAFEVLDLIVAKRLSRGLTTVIDSTGLDAKRRAAWRGAAERAGIPAFAVVCDAPAAVVREPCAAEGRDAAEITVTHLRAARVVADGDAREGRNAATVEEHVGAYRELAEAGVQTAIVGLRDADVAAVEAFAAVIAAFR